MQKQDRSEWPTVYDRKETEEKWRTFWEKERVFAFDPKSKAPLYIADTPPPYVSADHLHAGHIMSYTQAEFIVRYKRMRGFNVFYPMGFDDNGLPTERFVEKKYKINKAKTSKSEFIKLCLKETEAGSETYRKLWNMLGISVDWSLTYSTISSLATKVSQWSLIDLYEKGHLYRDEKPIMWCTHCRTALSQADIEDEEKKTNFVHIEVRTEDGDPLVFATTRPELLPSCVGISVHPDDARYRKFVGKTVTMPITGAKIPLTTDEMIDPLFGTGVVYFCSSGDAQFLDWETRHPVEKKIYLLETDGRMNEQAGTYKGLTVMETRKKIVENLSELGVIKNIEKIEHAVGTHERCGTDVEYVKSKQWFIKVVDQKETWRKVGESLNWYPQHMKHIYDMWVDSLKWDWCISRQRYYGVPFPLWYCASCETPIFANKDQLPVNPLEDSPPEKTCPSCGGKEMIPEEDVLDTWATSSCTPFLLRELVGDKKIKEKLFPPTLRPNAFEIIRTWDFYSVVKSHYHFNSVPFTDVMISGHGLDEHGRKISKRLGNYVSSDDLLEEWGADAIRYWATGATLGQNLRFNPSEIKKGKRTTIKLWNVARFLSMYLSDAGPKKTPSLEESDIWILRKFNEALEASTKAFDEYAYAKSRDETDRLFWSFFADYYVEFVKHRLSGNDESSKQAAQWTLSTVFSGILRMYAPILPFITDELNGRLFGPKEKSIHGASWPQAIKLPETDISGFEVAVEAIDEIKKFKSDQKISLGAELETYTVKTPVNLEKYGSFISGVMRVKDLRA